MKRWIRALERRMSGKLARLPQSGLWFLSSITVTLAVGSVLSALFWGWLDVNSATIRNVGLVMAGVIALLLAVWRGLVAERQADTAQGSLLNERYQKGAEMLGSEVLSVRLGGIYALQRLASEHPQQYHIQVMRLLCAFVRHPTKDQAFVQEQVEVHPETPIRIRPDMEAVLDAITSRSEASIALEKQSEFGLDLRGANLQWVQFGRSDLSDVWFHHANLVNASFTRTNLSNALFISADLSEARFWEATFTGVRFWGAKLTGASLPSAVLHQTDFKYADASGADFYRADLSRADFQQGTLGGAHLQHANLKSVKFLGADLSNARFERADLSGASFCSADMTHAHLAGANLSNAEMTFGGPRGLTQRQLDEASAHPDRPPRLEGVLDAETSEQLVWRGGLVEDVP